MLMQIRSFHNRLIKFIETALEKNLSLAMLYIKYN
jgi:hypothetical protein